MIQDVGYCRRNSTMEENPLCEGVQIEMQVFVLGCSILQHNPTVFTSKTKKQLHAVLPPRGSKECNRDFPARVYGVM